MCLKAAYVGLVKAILSSVSFIWSIISGQWSKLLKISHIISHRNQPSEISNNLVISRSYSVEWLTPLLRDPLSPNLHDAYEEHHGRHKE